MTNTPHLIAILNDGISSDLTPSLNQIEPLFFPVSLTKLIVLSICTFGLYQVYWFFQNWQIIRIRERSISAVWRTLLAPLFCYGLFKRISQNSVRNMHPALLASVFFILYMIGSIPSLYSIIWELSTLVLIPVQIAVNRINKEYAPDHDPNARFTVLNIIVVIIGLAIIGLVILSVLVQ